jgi:putative hydrolase of the HAD superfamily
MSERKLLIFDLDDTLVDTSHIYWLARSQFLKVMERIGFPQKVVMERFENMDGSLMKKFGHKPERYEKSMLATYADFAMSVGENQSIVAMTKIKSAGKIVPTSIPRVIPGARRLLRWAKQQEYKISLLTRGEVRLQKKKIKENQLAEYFDDICIVGRKSKQEFRQAMRRAGSHPRDTWVIGDSIRSDINPGLQAGANCILYHYAHHSYYWRQEYGETPIGSFYVVRKLDEIRNILSEPDRFSKVRGI